MSARRRRFAHIGSRHSNEYSNMPDDLSKKGPADRSRINLSEPYEVQYWADKFGVSKERLSEAVRKVGHSADVVGKELQNNTSL
jgi:Protein of unknown function (DUF3606)